jgi:hypothetical protein
MLQAGEDGDVTAGIAREAEKTKSGVAGADLSQYRGRIVGRVIIDEHDFPGDVESAKGPLQPLNQEMDAVPFVVYGNYHTQNHDCLKILAVV